MARQSLLTLVLFAVPGCSHPVAPEAVRRGGAPDLEWNFAGLCVPDWPGAFQFYTEVLGFRERSRDGSWALLGAGWDRYRAGDSRGLVLELFEGGGGGSLAGPNPEPTIRLGITVRDLDATVRAVAARGGSFVTPVKPGRGMSRAELLAPGGARWILEEDARCRETTGLAEPEIKLAEMGVADLEAQRSFYHKVLGMGVVEEGGSHVVLQQAPDGPLLVLRPGGRRHSVAPEWARAPARSQPVFLSFMTHDVKAVEEQLRNAGVVTLHPVAHHDWGGTDWIVADADGNAVQIYQLDRPHDFGSQRPKMDAPGGAAPAGAKGGDPAAPSK